jgi:PBP1b-binding outer membrane lipoprotein LpoB
MKKIIIALSLVASILTIVGCSSTTATEQAPTSAPVHHDLKGEVGK